MTEDKAVKSNRDTTFDRVRTKYPDRNFDDDEAIFSQINEDYEDYDKRLSEYDSREKAFSDMFTKDHRSARLMMEWKNGGDIVVELIRMYGKEELQAAIDDPERLQKIEEANRDFNDRVAESDKLEEEYDKNLPKSLETLATWAEEKRLDDGVVDQVMGTLSKIHKEYLQGIFTRETFDMILNALNYESATEEARMEGEVAGRNAKIDEKLRKGKRGDGTPQLDGKSGGTEGKPKRDLGALERYDGTDANIWERGNEKRIARR